MEARIGEVLAASTPRLGSADHAPESALRRGRGDAPSRGVPNTRHVIWNPIQAKSPDRWMPEVTSCPFPRPLTSDRKHVFPEKLGIATVGESPRRAAPARRDFCPLRRAANVLKKTILLVVRGVARQRWPCRRLARRPWGRKKRERTARRTAGCRLACEVWARYGGTQYGRAHHGTSALRKERPP